ncbi:MAG: response regulator [Gammaproteobacteria bacterium]|nr:MAG: response regulator [Gammaproteobacteria bacterium]
METVVIVDDDPSIVGALKRALRKMPYEFVFFTDSEEALDYVFKGGALDVIISDYRMPEIDGLTFLKSVDKLHRKCVKIIMSGEADMSILQKAINEVGIFQFISKPWDGDELKEAIEKAVMQQQKNLINEHLADIGRHEAIDKGSLADQWLADQDE